MKKRVSLSVKTIVYVLLFAAGTYFGVIYGTQWFDSAHPMDISLVTEDMIKNNMYVTCEISVYLGEGSAADTKGFLYDYHYYDILLSDGKYLHVGVHDIDLYNRLETLGMSNDKIPIVGKFVKKELKLDEERYAELGVSTDRFISEYVLDQEVKAEAMNKCLLAAFLALVSFFGFFRSFNVIYIEEEVILNRNPAEAEKNRRKQLEKKYKNVNLDYELELATRRVDRIHREYEKQKRMLVPGIAFVVAGALYTVYGDKTYRILSIVVALYGLIKIWKVFFNSGARPAVALAEVFSINTLYRQFRAAEAKKSEIIDELYEKKKGEEKKVTAMGRAVDKAVIIDCDASSEPFMMPIRNNIQYAVRNHGEDIPLKINTDELLHEDQYVQWGHKKKDIGVILNTANRDSYFIHFGDIDVIWMVANDKEYTVSPVGVLRLHHNCNVTVDNINVGIENKNGEKLNPMKLRLRRTVYCIGAVTVTLEYKLNNLGKPELLDDDLKYYYINEEYLKETFKLESDIRAWQVPANEEDIDKSVAECPIVDLPRGTKFTRMRVPRRAAYTYIDLYLEDDRIIRVREDHRREDNKDIDILLDADKKEISYVTD